MTTKELESFKKIPRNDILIYLHQNEFLETELKIKDLYDRINKSTSVFSLILDDLIFAKLIVCENYKSRYSDKSSFFPTEFSNTQIKLTELGTDYVESRIFGFNHQKYDDFKNPAEQFKIGDAMSGRLMICHKWTFEEFKPKWNNSIHKENAEKRVFISYSWDSEINTQHKEWVAKIASDLSNEFQIEFDKNLEVGMSPENYMKHNILSSDYVIIIFTPNYCAKANSDIQSGVKYEFSVIKENLFRKISTGKYIPILRSGSKNKSIPKEMQDAIYIDFKNDETYSNALSELVKKLGE